MAVNEGLGALLADVSLKTGLDLRIVSRSDSTLRGHFPAETDALARGWTAGGGEPIDGVLLCPHFFEAGRIVGDDTLWVKDGEDLVPAAETEFAADPVFGYRNSNLLRWVKEKSGGSSVQAVGVGLDDLRGGGPDRVGRLLEGISPGSVVSVNAVEYADLEVFVLGLLEAEAAGKRFLYRTGPSFVGARSANRSSAPLTHEGIFEDGEREGHGLVVVGSHTGLTTRQVRKASKELGLSYVELGTRELLDERRDAELSRVVSLVERELASGDVIVATGREALGARDKETGLAQGRIISDALVELVSALDPKLPIRYLVAKGGITSHDVAARGLKAARAQVLGQMRRGMVSVWRLDDEGLRSGLPYVVFPGNVGNDDTLLEVLDTLRREA